MHSHITENAYGERWFYFTNDRGSRTKQLHPEHYFVLRQNQEIMQKVSQIEFEKGNIIIFKVKVLFANVCTDQS